MSERPASGVSRRSVLSGALALLAWPRTAWAGTPAPPWPGLVDSDGVVRPEIVPGLEQSEFAYVSPLQSNGSASRCHGEIWYAWLDGAVWTSTSAKSWKARAQAKGLDRARIWFGNYGRWKHPGGNNEAFRRGMNFEAKVHRVADAAHLDRILGVYAKKYPSEIGRWRDRMRTEVASGKRVILRYEPLPSPPGKWTVPTPKKKTPGSARLPAKD